jgi:DNA-binding NtrC family response regulator
MIRILFVDDDQDILAGLRNRLRAQRSRWDMVFVQSGYEALEELELASFDVVVSDMRMPLMDGAELLAQVKDRHPDVARIVLSGDAERDAVQRALPIVHQFLTKPCDGNVLRAAIEQVLANRP